MTSDGLPSPLWQYEDLEGPMTDALVNNKPQFVRLFTENGLNILDYLTYERLENLYRSLPNGSLAYTFLQRHLLERLSITSSPRADTDGINAVKNPNSLLTESSLANELTLFEVGQDAAEKVAPDVSSWVLLKPWFPVPGVTGPTGLNWGCLPAVLLQPVGTGSWHKHEKSDEGTVRSFDQSAFAISHTVPHQIGVYPPPSTLGYTIYPILPSLTITPLSLYLSSLTLLSRNLPPLTLTLRFHQQPEPGLHQPGLPATAHYMMQQCFCSHRVQVSYAGVRYRFSVPLLPS